ncbi:hypothetical protein FA15DRAFT_674165 [Coprinopsis marcescibilis]|uniref:Uncharacterized protein n=1 Tax=Coprinopsis marcescibilis TaxID=230819 RepID=A0A5C3KIL1_COPMA|nr:hypothetical protein FA15DRAFT_674165 [Coprinopsis marcescibilis]
MLHGGYQQFSQSNPPVQDGYSFSQPFTNPYVYPPPGSHSSTTSRPEDPDKTTMEPGPQRANPGIIQNRDSSSNPIHPQVHGSGVSSQWLGPSGIGSGFTHTNRPSIPQSRAVIPLAQPQAGSVVNPSFGKPSSSSFSQAGQHGIDVSHQHTNRQFGSEGHGGTGMDSLDIDLRTWGSLNGVDVSAQLNQGQNVESSVNRGLEYQGQGSRVAGNYASHYGSRRGNSSRGEGSRRQNGAETWPSRSVWDTSSTARHQPSSHSNYGFDSFESPNRTEQPGISRVEEDVGTSGRSQDRGKRRKVDDTRDIESEMALIESFEAFLRQTDGSSSLGLSVPNPTFDQITDQNSTGVHTSHSNNPGRLPAATSSSYSSSKQKRRRSASPYRSDARRHSSAAASGEAGRAIPGTTADRSARPYPQQRTASPSHRPLNRDTRELEEKRAAWREHLDELFARRLQQAAERDLREKERAKLKRKNKEKKKEKENTEKTLTVDKEATITSDTTAGSTTSDDGARSVDLDTNFHPYKEGCIIA